MGLNFFAAEIDPLWPGLSIGIQWLLVHPKSLYSAESNDQVTPEYILEGGGALPWS
jgi:hypothetical protein